MVYRILILKVKKIVILGGEKDFLKKKGILFIKIDIK